MKCHTGILSKAEFVQLSRNVNVISTLDSCNGFLLFHSSKVEFVFDQITILGFTINLKKDDAAKVRIFEIITVKKFSRHH